VALYWYHYRINDLIERYQTQTDFFFFRNRGRARLRGVELEAHREVWRGYSLELAANLARGRAVQDDGYLDDISPSTFSVIGRKRFGDHVQSQLRIARHAEDTRPGPSEIATPGATVLDIGTGWQVLPQLEVRGSVRNLLNDTYYASPDPRWVLAAGRSVSITAVVHLWQTY
jgi:outer membrane receptor protein involved in Fe transport